MRDINVSNSAKSPRIVNTYGKCCWLKVRLLLTVLHNHWNIVVTSLFLHANNKLPLHHVGAGAFLLLRLVVLHGATARARRPLPVPETARSSLHSGRALSDAQGPGGGGAALVSGTFA